MWPIESITNTGEKIRPRQRFTTGLHLHIHHVLISSRFIRITLESTGQDLREWCQYINFLSTATDDKPSRFAAILQVLRPPTKRRRNSLHHTQRHMPSQDPL
jgi:hypothetical protein